MSTNDVILLQDMIDKARLDLPDRDPSVQEAYFVSKNYLRYFRPSHDDLLSGIVDGEGDGGLDAIYILVNGLFIRDEQPLHALGLDANIQLILIQVKNTSGFGEAPLDKLIVHLPKLLSFTRDEDAIAKQFNQKVVEITRRFTNAYRSLQTPNLSMDFVFASLKSSGQVSEGVLGKANHLKEVICEDFFSTDIEVNFLGAADVWEMAGDRIPTEHEIVLSENPISTDIAGGYIGVVKLDEYQNFITDEQGYLDSQLFEANVRDYEGDAGVNSGIKETLSRDDASADFWWLNNGVTIVADRVQPMGKILRLSSPQIVNGLQTSHEIYKRTGTTEGSDRRNVMVKIIQVDSGRVRDQIIRATNSQTALSPSALRATDKVQRQIEEFLQGKGLFYERRKNYYYNRSIEITKLVSIDQMGQAVMATCVGVPHVARGEVSRIFDPEVYGKTFSENHPIEMFYNAIRIVRYCEHFLRSDLGDPKNVEDFLFHLSMLVGIAGTRKINPRAQDLARLESLPDSDEMVLLLGVVRTSFSAVANRTGATIFERVSKSDETSKELIAQASKYLRSSTRPSSK